MQRGVVFGFGVHRLGPQTRIEKKTMEAIDREGWMHSGDKDRALLALEVIVQKCWQLN